MDARRQDGRCPRFRRLVIETTGLANPNPVVHALQNDRRIAARFRLAAVIALVDAVLRDLPDTLTKETRNARFTLLLATRHPTSDRNHVVNIDDTVAVDIRRR